MQKSTTARHQILRAVIQLYLALFSVTSLAQVEAAKPWLGVAIDQGAKGVLIKEIISDTPAAAAGLESGDEILAINGIDVKAPADLIKTIQAQGVGHTVVVHFLRKGKKSEKSIKLVA
ncbi:serine protease, partial [Planctomyces bekefii]